MLLAIMVHDIGGAIMQEISRRASRALPAMPEQDNGQQTAQLRRQLQEQTTEIATLKVKFF